jgi:starch-binding outer membrane protein, SusD/RagB family
MFHFKLKTMQKKSCYIFILLPVILLFFSSCRKFVENGTPPTSLTEDKAFIDSATATSSVLAMYTRIANTNPPNNSMTFNITKFGAMSADVAYYLTNTSFDNFRNNTLAAGNDLNGLWSDLYANIGRANYAIKNLEASTTLSTAIKNQLLGETKFLRAWSYFYLVNFFGDVPLVINTDALTNALLPRTPSTQVYQQIVADLTDAKNLLTNNYPSIERARANKRVAAAFLSRVYFYQQNWAAAEAEASEVINSSTYSLATDLNSVFIKTSNEVILQVANVTGVTSWGGEFIPASTTPNVVLYDTLANAFELNDQRKVNWTKPIVYSGKTYFYPHKYKVRSGTTGNEYHVMLRLAEMYLIRAEARANQNNITGAVSDINLVRQRTGVAQLLSTITKEALLVALERERWVELFTEWADRWFNLKRLGKADAVLSHIKPQFQPFQKLYPIPNQALQANPNLENNPGY